MIKRISNLFIILATTLNFAQGAETTLTVQVDKPGAPPTEFGIFYEDINFAGDGGLYPELVKNRSFEFFNPLMGWKELARNGASGKLSIETIGAMNINNPHFLRVTVEKPGTGFGLANEGFRGMGIARGEKYEMSFYARSTDLVNPVLSFEVESAAGNLLASGHIKSVDREWKKYSVTLKASATDAKAHLNLVVLGAGTVDLDMISLYPCETFKNRPNGMRKDIAQLLADLKPALMRFPGGCIVEGHYLTNRYQWKTTIGDLAERKLIMNRWNDEFKHRPAPDYFQSFGLGFYEFFQLCEDIGAKPLPILNCGMACQFNSNELVPCDQLQPYIQDALDLVEFANGAATTSWGERRAAMGHKKPFNMSLLGVGNEQWGAQYIERYEPFAKALKAQYPQIKLISSSGPSPDGKDFDFAWEKLRALNADVIDEHYYSAPSWFLKNAHRYDHYNRQGPKVFAGEYAAQSDKVCSPENRNNWECALAEAAFMTGLERNSDVVTMASYAPLLAHVDGWQWRPNLIWFDNLHSYGTPNYYVQQLYGVHRGTAILPCRLDQAIGGLYATTSYDSKTREVIIKLVNSQAAPKSIRINLAGTKKTVGKGKTIVLASDDLKAENSLESPRKVAPQSRSLSVTGPQFDYSVTGYSMTVIRVSLK